MVRGFYREYGSPWSIWLLVQYSLYCLRFRLTGDSVCSIGIGPSFSLERFCQSSANAGGLLAFVSFTTFLSLLHPGD